MPTVEVPDCGGGHEKLASVCVLSRVGHGKQTGNSVADKFFAFSPLIVKFLSIYGFTTSSISSSKVATLQNFKGILKLGLNFFRFKAYHQYQFRTYLTHKAYQQQQRTRIDFDLSGQFTYG